MSHLKKIVDLIEGAGGAYLIERRSPTST